MHDDLKHPYVIMRVTSRKKMVGQESDVAYFISDSKGGNDITTHEKGLAFIKKHNLSQKATKQINVIQVDIIFT